MSLDKLKNTSRPSKARKRVGRGLGSKSGKTCGRGEKGAKARAGSKMRLGKEGGQMPLFMKLPIRGFSNARFRRVLDVVNLEQLNEMYEDGETVNIDTLRKNGFISGRSNGIKLLGSGELTVKVDIQVHAISDGAREKLTRAKINFNVDNQPSNL